MNLVQTTAGLIKRDHLEVVDTVTEGANYRAISTKWFLDGVMVREDAAVSILSGHALAGVQGEFQ